MRVIWEVRSQNGRWGAEIVSASEAPVTWPARGELLPLGERDGIRAFEFRPSETAGTWVLPGDDLEAVEGSTVAWTRDLQGHRQGTILVMGPLAVIRQWGYRRRSSRSVMYRDGEAQEVPTSVLLALGLIEPERAPEAIAPPPAPSGVFAEALAAALGRRAD